MNLLVVTLIVLGLIFFFGGVVGLLRFPDFYTRMHAATKAGAFGGMIILLLCAFYFASLKITLIVLVNIIFFYFTAPVAAHMIARSAYINRIKPWKGTKVDELDGKIVTKEHINIQ